MQELDAIKIHFLNQQDGEIEKQFLSNVSKVFRKYPAFVTSAYLCRIHYGDPNSQSVALCMTSQHGHPREILEEASRVFREMFGPHEHLDMLFLTGEQVTKIQAVCNPFYVA